jgi:probable HAF family extracellular repeat protein
MLDLGIGGAYAINNQGSVAGTAGRHVGALEAFIYRDGQVHLLGKLEKGLNSDALGINNHDVVVGQSDLDPWQTTRYTPFIWNAVEGIVDLNSLIPPDSGWSLSRTSDINDFGQITGYGYNEGKGEAFRLDPIPPRLSIECHSTHIIVFWHPNWPGLVLETTHNLVAPNWHPLDTGGTNVVTISTTTVMRFFRLNLDGIRGLCCSPQ